MNDDTVFDVAIVGYGPVGAVAAGLLGQAGWTVYVGERQKDVHPIPRAIALDHEIMRVFQQLGVVDAIEPHCEPFTPSEYFGVDGQLIRRMTMVEPPYPQGHTPSLVFTQPPVEQALRARVAEMPGVTVELGVEVNGIEQDQDGVTLHLGREGGVAGRVRARYAIACDGGSSTVRTLLGMSLDDLDFDEPWLVVDVRVNERGLAKLPTVSVQYCEPERPCTMVIGPKNHRRWEISLKPGEDPTKVASAAETWKLLARWLTPDDGELWRQSSYRFHALVAADWRRGRIFLAGDAAHMQPPFLGQGMCQGVRDAANLVWKLGAVLRGDVLGAAADALLDSYGAERKAHVRELTSRIKAIGAVICERDVEKARARDRSLLAACSGTVKDTPRQDVMPQLSGGLLSSRTDAARGSLFPQPWLRVGDGRQRMDAVFGNGWRLVFASGTPVPASARDIQWLRVIALGADGAGGAVEVDGIAASWLARHACVAALVRPDNYVFGCAPTPADVEALLDELAAALGAAALCAA